MILKGKTEEALYYALLASSAGGLFGAFMHLFFYQPLFSLGLKFGRESLFWMGILDLTPISAMFPGHVSRPCRPQPGGRTHRPRPEYRGTGSRGRFRVSPSATFPRCRASTWSFS